MADNIDEVKDGEQTDEQNQEEQKPFAEMSDDEKLALSDDKLAEELEKEETASEEKTDTSTEKKDEQTDEEKTEKTQEKEEKEDETEGFNENEKGLYHEMKKERETRQEIQKEVDKLKAQSEIQLKLLKQGKR